MKGVEFEMNYMFFSSPHCFKCEQIKKEFADTLTNSDIEIINTATEEGLLTAVNFKVSELPTLIGISDNIVTKISNIDEIKTILISLQK